MRAARRTRHRRRDDERAKKVRFAVIGQGYFAQAAVLPAFASARNCELVALFSDDSAKLRKLRSLYGVQHALSYDEYDEFLESGAVDAVYIALPNSMHREYTVRAATAGVHVLCEKPMAVTEEECAQMIRACEDNRVRLMVGYRLHFEEANLSAVDLIQSGKLGDARLFASVFTFQVREGNIRLSRDLGGGPLYDIGIYCINAARYLFQDEPTEVVALTGTGSDPRFREVEEQVSAILRFPGDRLACFSAGFGGADESFYEVVGTKGSLCVESAYEWTEPIKHVVSVGGRIRQRVFEKRDQVAPELVYFADCILRDVTPEPSGVEGLADVRVIRAIYRAVQSGQKIGLEPFSRVRRPSLQQAMRKRAHGEPPLVGAEPPTRH